MARILHCSDLHLEHRFSGPSMTTGEARRRREEIRDALRRIVDLALAHQVDALTIGGDLYEDEYATGDTSAFLASQFRRMGAVPVLLAPGNHDPHTPDSIHARTAWSHNVTVFGSRRWHAVQIEDVVIWGIGHDGPQMERNVLQGLKTEGETTSIALFHGTDVSRPAKDGARQCPFTPGDLRRSGARFALLGHEHLMRETTELAYPGSPEPLGFFTEGPHYALLVTTRGSSIAVERLHVSRVQYQTKRIDVSRSMTASDLRRRVTEVTDGIDANTILRLVLTGRLQVTERLDELWSFLATKLRFVEVLDETIALAAGRQPALREAIRPPAMGRIALTGAA